jgi:creatinine amidohydrolase
VPNGSLGPAHWTDVDASLRRLLVVPVGSVEQHGPHLPLDTDTRVAAAVAGRACADLSGVWVSPPVAIGASGEHAAFPGTLSIGTEALATCLVELGRHASAHWESLLFVNGHGGNAEALAAARGRLRAEGRRCGVWHAGVPGGDAHAGRQETSLMLAIAPADVEIAAAAPGDTRPIAEIYPLLRERGVRELSPNGVLGDPSGASAEEGERMLETLTAGLRSMVIAEMGAST